MNQGKVLQNEVYEFFIERFPELKDWLRENPIVYNPGSNEERKLTYPVDVNLDFDYREDYGNGQDAEYLEMYDIFAQIMKWIVNNTKQAINQKNENIITMFTGAIGEFVIQFSDKFIDSQSVAEFFCFSEIEKINDYYFDDDTLSILRRHGLNLTEFYQHILKSKNIDKLKKNRNLSYEVVNWWAKNFPKHDFKNKMFEQIHDWYIDEEISPYVLFGISGAVQPYYDEKININDKAELKKFLDAFSKFYDEFFDKFQHGKCNDLEDYVATELFEWILDTEKSRLVYEALVPGKLKDFCKEYFKF